ncbi:hypothetical protein AAFH96_36890, partial [Polymorphospora sp. 2-325]
MAGRRRALFIARRCRGVVVVDRWRGSGPGRRRRRGAAIRLETVTGDRPPDAPRQLVRRPGGRRGPAGEGGVGRGYAAGGV